MLHLALHAGQMEEALVAVGKIRCFQCGKKRGKLHRNEAGVDHLSIGRARVDGNPRDLDRRRRGVEVLVLQLADCPAVYRISVVRTEARDVKPVCALADFLVRRKGDFHCAVRAVRREQQLGGRQNLRHARLIVRAEQCRAVGHDQAFADVLLQGSIVPRRKDNALRLVENNVSAIVGFRDSRVNRTAGRIRRGIHVGNQPVDRKVFGAVCGNRAVDVAGVIHVRVADTESEHLPDQLLAQHLLIGCRRMLPACFAGGCIKADKLQKSFDHRHEKCLLLFQFPLFYY